MDRKVVICTPTRAKPHQRYLDSLAASVPYLEAEGWQHATVYEVGSPYISHARSLALRKALSADATDVVFIDDDVSWDPSDLVKLLSIDAEVCAGTYRFKRETEEYMGCVMTGKGGTPLVRPDGCIEAHSVPAGFLRITREGVNRFMNAFPDLRYGEPCSPSVDLFNHGAHNGTWWGEDYAFTRRWREKCGKVWLIPDLNLDHWSGETAYIGNYHKFLLRQPGGSMDPARKA